MKAAIYTEYGTPDVVQFKEVEQPTPKDDEVLIKVHAASVNAADWHLLTADIFLVRLMTGGLRKPKDPRLGNDFAGQVVAVGKNVTRYKPGDEVYGCSTGAFAEYLCCPEKLMALKPTTMTYEQAAAVPMAAVTALQGLRGKVQAGYKVLINGASGGVGTFAVQIAKLYGAEVTAVCSTRNLEAARALGADHVIDYTQEDFTQNGKQYDVIFAANGYHPLAAYRRALTPNGVYIMAGGKGRQMFEALLLAPFLSIGRSQKLGSIAATSNGEDFAILKDMIEAGKIKSVIDRCYPLSETAEALRYLGAGHARGKVVINVTA